MLNVLSLFQNNIDEAGNLSSLYEYLKNSVTSPLSFDDILRSQIVYSVSAFDKLLHDIIRTGMVQIFMDTRQATPKYLAEPITITTYNDLVTATFPPKEYVFEQAIVKKLKAASYQDPKKVADGLSYIWNESQKWQRIAANMRLDDATVRTTLKLIVDRRNTIVHEADIDPSTNTKYSISKSDCKAITDFLEKCGQEIVNLVV